MVCLNKAIGAATSAARKVTKQKRMAYESRHARILMEIIQPVKELSMMMRNKNSNQMAQRNQTKKYKYDNAYPVQKCICALPDLHKYTMTQNGNDSGGKPKRRGRKDDNCIQPGPNTCRTAQEQYPGY